MFQDMKENWKKGAAKRESFMASVLGENPIPKEGNPYAQYLNRSILLEEASPPKNIRATVNIIVVFLTIFIIWATITDLDERASAPGVISPINFIQPVQHQEGGIIAQILVDNGEYVVPGQPLVILDDTTAKAQYDLQMARRMSLAIQIERQRAFALGYEPDFSRFDNTKYRSFISDNQQLFASQVAAREAQISVINSQITELRDEIEGLRLQEQTLEEEFNLIQEEVEVRQVLFDQGLGSKLNYLTAQRDLSRTRGQLADARSQTTAAEAGIRESSRRIVELEERLRNESFTEIAALETEMTQIDAQLTALADRVARTVIPAQVAGIVKGVIERPAGGVVSPAEVILEVVPTEQEMVAEIRISPRDIGHVKIGDPVLVKVETFNYARFGGVDGTLTHISAASFTDENTGEPYFRGNVELTQNFVGLDPRANQITPGMTLVADIKTGSKSLMAYLLRPIYNTLTQSFSER